MSPTTAFLCSFAADHHACYCTPVHAPVSSVTSPTHFHLKMSSSSEEEENKDTKVIDRSLFVRLLADHKVVLEKSKTPAMKKAKKTGWDDLCSEYCAAVGKFVTVNQLIRALNNIKTSVKTKTDVKATGNKSIKLQNWERGFMELIEDTNPVYNRIPGHVSVGLGEKIQKQQELSLSGSVVGGLNETVQSEVVEDKSEDKTEEVAVEAKTRTTTNKDSEAKMKKIRTSEKIVVATTQTKHHEARKKALKLEMMKKKSFQVDSSSQTDLCVDNLNTYLSL